MILGRILVPQPLPVGGGTVTACAPAHARTNQDELRTRDPDTGRWVLTRDRWHTGVVDSAGTGGLLAQVAGRSASVVSTWLLAQPAPWRDAITHVTIDLSASFAKGARDATTSTPNREEPVKRSFATCSASIFLCADALSTNTPGQTTQECTQAQYPGTGEP